MVLCVFPTSFGNGHPVLELILHSGPLKSFFYQIITTCVYFLFSVLIGGTNSYSSVNGLKFLENILTFFPGAFIISVQNLP